MEIRFEKAASLKQKPADETKLGFGQIFTDKAGGTCDKYFHITTLSVIKK